jgi:hypothetical protein
LETAQKVKGLGRPMKRTLAQVEQWVDRKAPRGAQNVLSATGDERRHELLAIRERLEMRLPPTPTHRVEEDTAILQRVG